MLRKGLVVPPRLRSEVGVADERHATWLELLYDLVFVAAIAQLAGTLAKDYTAAGLVRFGFVFVPVWWAWVGHTFYLTRFDSDDVVHRVLTLAQMVAVASLAVHTPQAMGATSGEFALSYAAVRFLLVVEYLRAGRVLPRVRPLTTRYCIGFGIAAALWALSALVPTPYRFGLWVVGLIVDFFAPLTAGAIHMRFPPHVMHLPERFGLFTIIVIGEAVAATVLAVPHDALKPASGLVSLFGLILAFSVWWNYFDGVHAADVRSLESAEHVRKYQQWLYSHLPLAMAVTAAAAGIRRVIVPDPMAPLPRAELWMLCGSLAAAMLALSSITLSSPMIRCTAHLKRHALPHHAMALLCLAPAAFCGELPGVAIVGLLAACGIAQIVLTLREVAEE